MWRFFGLFFVLLAIVGALLPVMPTVPFVLLAAACFAKSSPEMHGWLREHPKFGRTVRSWEEERCITRRMKVWSATMITLGGGTSTLLFVPRGWPFWVVTGCFLLADVAVLLWKECPAEKEKAPETGREARCAGMRIE